jgi:hypothetical protein
MASDVETMAPAIIATTTSPHISSHIFIIGFTGAEKVPRALPYQVCSIL